MKDESMSKQVCKKKKKFKGEGRKKDKTFPTI